jgi:hypothetical protein
VVFGGITPWEAQPGAARFFDDTHVLELAPLVASLAACVAAASDAAPASSRFPQPSPRTPHAPLTPCLAHHRSQLTRVLSMLGVFCSAEAPKVEVDGSRPAKAPKVEVDGRLESSPP